MTSFSLATNTMCKKIHVNVSEGSNFSLQHVTASSYNSQSAIIFTTRLVHLCYDDARSSLPMLQPQSCHCHLAQLCSFGLVESYVSQGLKPCPIGGTAWRLSNKTQKQRQRGGRFLTETLSESIWVFSPVCFLCWGCSSDIATSSDALLILLVAYTCNPSYCRGWDQ
jgi:hypothetical protein